MFQVKDIKVTHITMEPGDMTRYDFFIYKDGPESFTIAPASSSLLYPQRINKWELPSIEQIQFHIISRGRQCTKETNDWLAEKAKFYNCNPSTIAAVCKAIYNCFTYE